MYKKTVKIRNEAGIHCRPSSSIMQKAAEFSNCSIRVETDKGDADLSSILALMSLGLEQGDSVTVYTDGENEVTACNVIAELFAYEFDFPQE